MEDLGWKRRRGGKPRSPKGRAAARGLDARIRFQHPFMPAGDTQIRSTQSKIPLTAITVSTATEILSSSILKKTSLARVRFSGIRVGEGVKSPCRSIDHARNLLHA